MRCPKATAVRQLIRCENQMSSNIFIRVRQDPTNFLPSIGLILIQELTVYNPMRTHQPFTNINTINEYAYQGQRPDDQKHCLD